MALDPGSILRRWALLLVLCAGAASAQSVEQPLDSAGENVWSHGVSAGDRSAADALFIEGNKLLKESITITAAAKYREALTRWDHPNIHFNLALALMSLDQPVETHEHLVQAMRYGPEPLGKERFEHARNYLALLEKQLARIDVRCEVAGARVELDGRPLFTPPGSYQGLVSAGRHTIVASKEGFVTNQEARTLDGGTVTSIDLPLRTMSEMTRTHRRWPAWKPWSIVGAGAAIALGGIALRYEAGQRLDWVDRQSTIRCVAPNYCNPEPADFANARRQATTYQNVAVGAYVVGGAAILTGAVLVVMNRAETVVMPYEERSGPPPQHAGVEVAPTLGAGRAGILATIRF
ncbi:PEGA domain-containing protein [Anaeromyxobacter oryzisoli]|uniref:PEGA domain-containing protein n=1 Tax=Anaeromyxobacter oryzisoli TaxID=2925408 RepID=UPI001F562E8E|nr:PEGA domain-containing protein [Anaeromyxobacter sp. SG63]